MLRLPGVLIALLAVSPTRRRDDVAHQRVTELTCPLNLSYQEQSST